MVRLNTLLAPSSGGSRGDQYGNELICLTSEKLHPLTRNDQEVNQ